MNKAFKRIVSSMLSASLTLTPAITAFAGGTSGSASGSTGGGVVTASGGDFGVNIPGGRIGIRLSLVDSKEPERVISVLSDGETPMVVDIMYVDEQQWLDYTSGSNPYLTPLTKSNIYSAVKTQSYTAKNEIARVYASEHLKRQIGTDIMPWAEYHDKAYYSKGADFVKWCRSNEFGDMVYGEDGNITCTYVNSLGEVVTTEMFRGGNSLSIDTDGSSGTHYEGLPRDAKGIQLYFERNMDDIVGAPGAAGGAGGENGYSSFMNYLSLMESTGCINSEEYEYLKGLLQKRKAEVDNGGVHLSSMIDKLTTFGMITAYAAEGDNSGTTADTTEGQQVGKIDAYINKLMTLDSPNDVPYLQTPSMVAKGTKLIEDATEDWVLLVEPIVYLTIFEPGTDKRYVATKQYGTISNIAEAIHHKIGGSYASKRTNGFLNWKALNGPLWGALSVAPTKKDGQDINGFMFADEKHMLTVPDGIGQPRSFTELTEMNAWKEEGGIKKKSGYGVNVYWKGQFESKIETWDKESFPDALPGPAPDASDPKKYPNESSYGKESKKFQIVKWYCFKNVDGTYDTLDVQTRKDTPHVVDVVPEGDLESEFYWTVEKWGTANSLDAPRDGDTSSTFESYWEKNKGLQSGKGPASVVIPPESTDKSIYVKLVMDQIERQYVDVVRVYETPNQPPVVEVETEVRVKNNKVDGNSPKPDYVYKENVNSKEPKKDIDDWSKVPSGKPGSEPNIPVEPDDKTIYIRYEKRQTVVNPSTGLVLHENEISHQFNLADANNGHLVEGVKNYSGVSADGNCPYTWTCGDDDCDGHSCSSPYEYTHSDSWHFTLNNNVNYGQGGDTRFVWDWRQTDNRDYSGNTLTESGGTEKRTPNMTMILQRSISDRGTLYPNMNNGNEGVLQNMGLNSPSYTPASQRKDGNTDQPNRKSWNESFTTNWEFINDTPDPTAYFVSDHGYEETDTHSQSDNASEINSAYNKPGNTTVHGVWGKTNNGIATLTDTAQLDKWDLNGLKFTGRSKHSTESAYKFHPYYKMKFIDVLDGAEKDAYLTSENESTLLTLQRIDSAVLAPSNAHTLELTSSQWSIHSKAHSLLAEKQIKDSDSLLPAGAIYDLKTAGDDSKAPQNWIGYRIFHSYIPDKSVLKTSDKVKNKDEVLQAVSAFESNTKNVLDNYEVVMRGQVGYNTQKDAEFFKDSIQVTGKAGKYKMGQNEFIRDGKYDLQTGGTGANSSDINILEEHKVVYDWTITSDADGNVTVSRDGVVLETLNKTKSTLTNAEVKEFNERTNLVTNFLNGIDRNLGHDRSNDTWYNEGFSIGCIEVRLAYRMGFGDGADSIRSTALNIKANGLLADRTDMFSLEEEKGRSYQFFTSNKSLVNEAASKKDGYVGTYDGIDIFVPGIHTLLMSKRFYTSNTTVMDLN